MTVATCVCCSMTSESQMRYGSRVRCHGRSCRPAFFCQAISRAAKEPDALPRRIACEATRRSAAEALLRFGGGVRAGETRDDVLERAPRAGVVAQLDLTARDVEEGIGNLLAVGIGGQQLSLRRDRPAVIALRVLSVTLPVHRGRGERAARIRADETLEARDRGRIAAALELVEGGVVSALLGGQIAGDRRTRRGARTGGTPGRRGASQHARCAWARSALRGRRTRRGSPGACAGPAFELA